MIQVELLEDRTLLAFDFGDAPDGLVEVGNNDFRISEAGPGGDPGFNAAINPPDHGTAPLSPDTEQRSMDSLRQAFTDRVFADLFHTLKSPI